MRNDFMIYMMMCEHMGLEGGARFKKKDALYQLCTITR